MEDNNNVEATNNNNVVEEEDDEYDEEEESMELDIVIDDTRVSKVPAKVPMTINKTYINEKAQKKPETEAKPTNTAATEEVKGDTTETKTDNKDDKQPKGLNLLIPQEKIKEDQQRSISIFEQEIEDLEEKPWRNEGVDITDYFNYGFNEQTWMEYCRKQHVIRYERNMQSSIEVLTDHKSNQNSGQNRGGYNDQRNANHHRNDNSNRPNQNANDNRGHRDRNYRKDERRDHRGGAKDFREESRDSRSSSPPRRRDSRQKEDPKHASERNKRRRTRSRSKDRDQSRDTKDTKDRKREESSRKGDTKSSSRRSRSRSGSRAKRSDR